MKTANLNILVFDDTAINRESATLLLGKDHNLTVVGTYDEAQAALLKKVDKNLQEDLFAAKYGDKDPYKSGIDDALRNERVSFFHGEAKEKATTYPNFDVLLTDLMVPASRQAQGGEGLRFVGQEMPIGTTIALLALCAGVKKVAVVTDMNHHHHPASAAFDCFGECKADGIDILCTNHVGSISVDEATGEPVSYEFLRTPEGKEKYPQLETWGEYKGLKKGGKDWKSILLELTGNVETQEK